MGYGYLVPIHVLPSSLYKVLTAHRCIMSMQCIPIVILSRCGAIIASAVRKVSRTVSACDTPFTRYNRLSIRVVQPV